MWPGTFLHLLIDLTIIHITFAETFVLGYLTGSQRLSGDLSYERPGRAISGAISFAVDQVNADWSRNGLPHKLAFIVAETFGDEETSISETARLWRDNVSGYIGPQETCVHEARMASAFNLPMISYYCTQPETSDKRVFKTFARTKPSDTQISKSVAALLLTFHWYQVVFCYLDQEGGTTGRVAKTVLDTFKEAGIKILATRNWYKPYQFPFSESIFNILVEETYKNARIYVILGSHDEHLGLLSAMEERKLLTSGDYFVVGVHLETYKHEDPSQYMRGLLRETIDPFIIDAFTGYFGIIPSSSITFQNFSRIVNEYLNQPPFNFTQLIPLKRMIPPEAGYLYDAVLLYAQGLRKVLENGGDPRNGTAIIDAIKGVHYLSGRGYMSYLNQNADAQGNYTLIARRNQPNSTDTFGLHPIGVFKSIKNDSSLPVLELTDEIYWINGVPPIDEPLCGFRGEKCINYTWQKVGIVAGSLGLVLIVSLLVFYRNWKYEQELDSLLWKVDFRDIQISEEDNGEITPKLTRATHPLMRTSQVSLSSNPDTDFRYSAIFTTIGIYKGRVLAIKRVRKKSIDITRNMKKELKMMRDLRHENLNPFIGACTDAPNICIISEYCTRGSLRDILENDDVKLDNMFVASLVSDIIRGMIFLHDSLIRHHGRLKTSNCLVDSRWVLKISDYGLHEFKKGADILTDENSIAKRLEGMLYLAPEILRSMTHVDYDENIGTQKGDIYSFGIILYELHSRQGPFGETTLTPGEVLEKVKCQTGQEKPFRPPLEPLEGSFDFVRDCLKECWAEAPELRPDFKTVRAKLRPMKKGMKPNIFDNMMSLMEKYTNNLEALVDERTDQLMIEKKKTEALLYEMLPRPVAEQLKKGNKVEAENYDSVTIYFSDIVGFTAMSAESTPLQIVDFLNDLYTCFDSIVEHYNVYKVETIGDAYMVVSGLPLRNGDEHAAEIASMSLNLVKEVSKFKIKHRPDEPLLLRIGIHSGPVCAGVVGHKMPRYCLFGDTVNTASRMESNGLPGRIHCSLSTKELLDHLGGYTLDERGYVPMKGKGEQLTYWLIGEDETFRKARKQTKKPEIGPRSSLKPKKSDFQKRNPIIRCSSLESPKKIRFASVDLLDFQKSDLSNNPVLEIVSDISPAKNGFLKVDHNAQIRRTSSSCPCIEHFAENSGPIVPQNSFNSSTSVPILASNYLLKKNNIHIFIGPEDENICTPLLNTSDV